MRYLLCFILFVSGCSFYPRQFSFHTIQSHTVKITDTQMRHGGTGFIISSVPDSRVVTNAHVCGEDTSVLVEKGGIKYLAHVVKVDLDSDLCLISVPVQLNVPGLVIAKKQTESQIYSYGWAYLQEPNPRSGYTTVRAPIQIALSPDEPCNPPAFYSSVPSFYGNITVCLRVYDAIMTTLLTFPGNSGSAVVNKYNEVVGVIFIGSGTGYGGMIPLERLRAFLELDDVTTRSTR